MKVISEVRNTVLRRFQHTSDRLIVSADLTRSACTMTNATRSGRFQKVSANKFARTFAEQQRAMHAKRVSRGILKSCTVVKAAERICEAVALDYVKQAVDRVSVVATDASAFAMTAIDLTIPLGELKAPVDQAIEFTTGTGPEKTLQYASIYAEGNRLFRELETRASRLLEIQRFNFLNTGKSQTANPFPMPTAPPPLARSNPGGKPLAEHWDALWAEIAIQLWDGELDPKRQADITKAMSDWLTSLRYRRE